MGASKRNNFGQRPTIYYNTYTIPSKVNTLKGEILQNAYAPTKQNRERMRQLSAELHAGFLQNVLHGIHPGIQHMLDQAFHSQTKTLRSFGAKKIPFKVSVV